MKKIAGVLALLFFSAVLCGQSMAIRYGLDFPITQKERDIQYVVDGTLTSLTGFALWVPNNVECCCEYLFPSFAWHGTERVFTAFSAEVYFEDHGMPQQMSALLGGGIEYCPPSMDFLPIRLSFDSGYGWLNGYAVDSLYNEYAIRGGFFALRPELSIGWKMTDAFGISFGYVNKFVLFRGNAVEAVWLWQALATLECNVILPIKKKA